MRYTECTFVSPAENLACEEVLLSRLEADGGDELLRIWEPRGYFVVLGHANRIAMEVHRVSCERLEIPIYRRNSGGGTVVQGRGCLNYSLFLHIDRSHEMSGVGSTNRYILGKIAEALRPELKQSVRFQGTSDLTLGGKKFSGNAQHRKRRFVLFHGTLLYDFFLPLIEILLPLPSREPDYRLGREHEDFMVNLPISREILVQRLRSAWDAKSVLDTIPVQEIQQLALSKYSQDAWTEKF